MAGDTEVKGCDHDWRPTTDGRNHHWVECRWCGARYPGTQDRPATLRVHLGDRKEGV